MLRFFFRISKMKQIEFFCLLNLLINLLRLLNTDMRRVKKLIKGKVTSAVLAMQRVRKMFDFHQHIGLKRGAAN